MYIKYDGQLQKVYAVSYTLASWYRHQRYPHAELKKQYLIRNLFGGASWAPMEEGRCLWRSEEVTKDNISDSYYWVVEDECVVLNEENEQLISLLREEISDVY